ncbi:MAG TPA: cytochrome c biogenesis protein ResB [Pyrinomonadaceae bacterium]|nr:cytochrome c biogenesis protein ResB [Pyrinomonadaceae bacterium]HMP65023.1 cytochrome c biogenesis protein ResB [Pyrinomonadaceae bacterium]
MSTSEETIIRESATRRRSEPFSKKVIDLLSSVRLGVVLLCILVVLSMIGMLIVQQNVNGFDAYFASLTPAERYVYARLGFFDIYHSWYFNFLLLFLSLNIVLASLERFPSAWSYIVKPKLTATKEWLLSRKYNSRASADIGDVSEVAETVSKVLKEHGFSSRTSATTMMSYATDADGNRDYDRMEKEDAIVVFGQRGKWNRLGAYIVHVSLLTLFLGHFVALQTGFDADVRMVPGDASDQIQMIRFDLDKKEKFNVQLPFTITCTDIEQKLIDPRGSISVTNTLDWRTQIRIDDPEYGVTTADVSMNNPFSYRGFRFFQAEASRIGYARSIVLDIESQEGGGTESYRIPRLGSVTTDAGMVIEYDEFLPDFVFGPDGRPDTRSGDYNNPVAVLSVTPKGGERTRVFAFEGGRADNLPVGAPKVGYKWKLAEYEKSPFFHVLSIKYDPYSGAFIAWYFGGFGLMFALSFVFFFSHRRIWAYIRKDKDGKAELVLGGDTNRNHGAFEQKFERVAEEIRNGINKGPDPGR